MKVKSIELWRLLFTISIVLCHAAVMPWSISGDGVWEITFNTHAVEFFFIVSGYLMMNSVQRKQDDLSSVSLGKETVAFVFRKIKPIFPAYLFSAITELLVSLLLRTDSVENPVWRIWDLLFLRASGLGYGRTSAVGAGWYLSAMLLGLYILYPLARKFRDTFTHIIAPLTAIFLLGWFETEHGQINFAFTFQSGVCLGLLRGISEMCLGAVCFAVCDYLKGRFRNTKPSILITIVELLSLGGMLYITTQVKRGKEDFLCILLISLGVIAAFTGRSYINFLLNKLHNRWTSWISTFSLCLYLNHYVWINTFRNWKIAVPFRVELILYLVLSLLTAVACYTTVKCCKSVAEWCRCKHNAKRQQE